MRHRLRVLVAVLWASPYSLFALAVGALCRGHFALVDGVVEIHSPGIAFLLRRLPVAAAAITLGHVVLGQTLNDLEVTRVHERVHVRQFSRWGCFMGPAYLGCSILLWLRGKDPYFENPFEIEAFRYAASAEARVNTDA